MKRGLQAMNGAGAWPILLGLTLAGCSEAVAPEDGLTTAEAELVATWITDVDATGGDEYGLSSDVRTGSYQFTRSASCPAGGTHGVSGSGTKTLDEDTRVLSTTWTTTQTHDQCGVLHARGDRQVTLVIDGVVVATGSASYQLPAEGGLPRQILTFTNGRVGSTTTTAGDRSRTCEIEVTESYDPTTNTFTITGTICGREVHVTRTPGERPRR
jgi:hypothetical protein